MKKSSYARLSQYTAIASTILASSYVRAQIIYSDLVPDVVLGVDEHYTIDLHNDNDFEFIFHNSGDYLGVENYFDYDRSQMLDYKSSGYRIPTKLHYGSVISEDLSHWGIGGGFVNTIAGIYAWLGKERFLAVRFRIEDMGVPGYHYGWIRIAVNSDLSNPTITIKDYAYQLDSHVPILAGEGLAGTGACINSFEPNDKFADAALINTNEEYLSLINPTGDKDFFSFSVSADEPHLKIVLSGLPKNYDIVLFNSLKEKIGNSKNLHREDEVIILNNAVPGLYYVKVFQKDGYFHADNCYELIAETSDNPFKFSPNNDYPATLRIYPNPAIDFLTIEFEKPVADIEVTVYDLAGKEIMISFFPPDLNSVQLNISSLSSGTYLLKTVIGNEQVIKKFSVTR